MVTLPPHDPTAPRIFLDASVILAGLMSRIGASYALMTLSELGLLRPVVCPYLMTGVERNLQRKVPEIIPLYQQLRLRINWEITPDPPDEAVSNWLEVIPAKDAPVLAAAVLAAPHRLVTLDARHFLKSPEIIAQTGLTICAPGELLREIRAILAQGFGNES